LRRSVTGDLTSAFNFVKIDTSVPSLPQPSRTDSRVTMSTCATKAPVSLATDTTNSLEALGAILVANYPVTVNSAPPRQESGSMGSPSGPVLARADPVPH
jgi:phospholipase C